MEYIFGTEHYNNREIEVVKIVSDVPVQMSGRYTIERKYDDNNITDNFRVIDKIREINTEDKYYVWYEIDNHYRFFDKFTPQAPVIDEKITGTEDAICETTEEMTQGFADIEDAICELTEMINQ